MYAAGHYPGTDDNNLANTYIVLFVLTIVMIISAAALRNDLRTLAGKILMYWKYAFGSSTYGLYRKFISSVYDNVVALILKDLSNIRNPASTFFLVASAGIAAISNPCQDNAHMYIVEQYPKGYCSNDFNDYTVLLVFTCFLAAAATINSRPRPCAVQLARWLL